jgi:hypothetical protein
MSRSSALWAGNSGNIGVSPTLPVVTSTGRTSSPVRPAAAGSPLTLPSAVAACRTAPLPSGCLDRSVAETALTAASAGRRRCPNHLGIKPDRRRSATPQAVIASREICRLVLRRGSVAHDLQLPCWIYEANPLRRFWQLSPQDLPSLQLPCFQDLATLDDFLPGDGFAI